MQRTVLAMALVFIGCRATNSTTPFPSSAPPPDMVVPGGSNDGGAGGAGTPDDLAATALDLATHGGTPQSGVQKWCTTVAYANDPKNDSTPSDVIADASGHVFLVGAASPATTSAYAWYARIDGSAVAANVIVSKLNSATRIVLSPSSIPTLTRPLLRIGLDGTPDPSFKPDASLTNATSLRYQSTGKLVAVAGSALARIGGDGAFDASFGTQGTVTVAAPSTIWNLWVDAHDRIYVVGYSYASTWQVTRYGIDGALDTSFGTGGTLAIPAPPGNNGAFYSAINGDDLYLGGNYFAATGDAGDWVVHVTAAGVDMSYGVGGYAKVIGFPDYADGVAAQRNGALLLFGHGNVWFLGRVTPMGQIDRNYGTNGWVSGPGVVDGPNGETIYPPVAATVAPDGSAIVVQKKEYVQNLYSETSAIVCAYTP